MKLIRYIYPPDGQVLLESADLSSSGSIKSFPVRINRIEIYNIQGELVCICNSMAKIKLLKLQKGFYLLKKMDRRGRVITSNKIVF
jgi:hypothetical protein